MYAFVSLAPTCVGVRETEVLYPTQLRQPGFDYRLQSSAQDALSLVHSKLAIGMSLTRKSEESTIGIRRLPW